MTAPLLLRLAAAHIGGGFAVTAAALIKDELRFGILGAVLMLAGLWFLRCALNARCPR